MKASFMPQGRGFLVTESLAREIQKEERATADKVWLPLAPETVS